MLKQIVIDENNVVLACSIGGRIENGIDVDIVPDAVMECPSKWIYSKGKYSNNPNYEPPILIPSELSVEDLALAVTELAEMVSEDKLELEMALAELAETLI